jgi:YfiH family protein
MPVEFICPTVFNDQEQIKAFITLKNKGLFQDKRNIQGLNLGFNTQDRPSIVSQNRKILFRTFELDSEWTAFANQVHGNHVKIVSAGGTYSATDGFVTQVPGMTLAIQIADCAAVFIADTTANIIAAVHAGWRGAAGSIVSCAAEKMGGLGAEMERCKAFVSPCICAENFEVGPEVAEQFPFTFIDSDHYEKPHLNIKAYLHHQLQQIGVKDKNIEVHPDCTIANDQYYSYRREKNQSGRMMAVIQLQ